MGSCANRRESIDSCDPLHFEAVTPHTFLVLFDKLPAVLLCRVGIRLEETVVSK
jgi:hypothetical protein